MMKGRAPRPHGAGKKGLSRRRHAHSLRRILAGVFLALAIFLLLQPLGQMGGRLDVVVASRGIRRGQYITADMVHVRSLPSSVEFKGLASDKSQVAGRIARVPISQGDPLVLSMLTRMPALPEGTTQVGLILASDPQALEPGDRVELVAPVDCGTASQARQNGSRDPPEQPGGRCTIAERALTLTLPENGTRQQTDIGRKSSGREGAPDQDQVTGFALSPDEALRALSLGSSQPVIAVKVEAATGPGPD